MESEPTQAAGGDVWKSLAVLQKVKIRDTVRLGSSTPGYRPKRNENRATQKPVCEQSDL